LAVKEKLKMIGDYFWLGFLGWLIASVFVGGVAGACGGRNAAIWTVVAFVVSPLMALLALIALEVRALRPTPNP
jgi:uncharacterized membrane protein YhaH (DUF805 family)